MKSLRIAATLSLVALIALSVSCSKKEAGQAATSSSRSVSAPVKATDFSILNRLPQSLVGFLTWNATTPAYAKFKQSAWGQSDNAAAVSGLKSLADSPEDKKTIDTFYSLLTETGILGKTSSDSSIVGEGAVFLGVANEQPEFGAYMIALPGESFEDKIPAFKKAFTDEGHQVRDETFTGGSGFSIFVKKSEKAPNGERRVFLASKKGDLALTSEKLLAENYIAGKTFTGFEDLKSSARYKKAEAGLQGESGGRFNFGYFDLTQMIAKAPKDIASNKDVNLIPIEAFMFSRAMSAQLNDTASAVVNAKNEQQQTVINALKGTGKNNLLTQVPGNTLLLLGLDGNVLSGLAEAGIKEAPAAQQEAASAHLETLKKVSSLGIGVRGASGPSPFPELLVVAESADAPSLQGIVKTLLGAAVSSAGMPLSPWQTKEVEGISTDFLMSPLGIGIYLGSSPGGLILASSEGGLRDSIKASKDESSSLIAKIPSSSKQLAQNNSVFVAYSNFEDMADLIESFQGSLAMFTGGKANVKQKDLDQLRKMGEMVFAVNFSDGLLKMRGSYDAPPVQKASLPQG